MEKVSLQFQLVFFLLAVALNSSAQEKSVLTNEIEHHRASGDFKAELDLCSVPKLIEADGTRVIEMLILPEHIKEISSDRYPFLSLSVPIPGERESIVFLKRRRLSDADFKIVIQSTGSNHTGEIPQYVAYSGVVNGEESNSLVSLIIYNDTLLATFFIGKRQFSLKQISGTLNSYHISEIKLRTDLPDFNCGTDDNDNNDLKNNVSQNPTQASPGKCVRMHFEITKSLNDQFGGVDQSVLQLLSMFNIAQTKFFNEGVTVRISNLKIWDTDDPYYQSWFGGNPGDPGAFQDLGFQSFQLLGGNIDGNIGMLLSTYSGGIAGVAGGAPCPNQGYAAVRVYENSLPQNVITMMHEIGHNLGSHHTHWCGWVGGAIDNCYATEGGCPSGPNPANGGTIMSYCGDYWNIINNGFGTQPRNAVLDYIASESCVVSCDSQTSCSDNVVNVVGITNTTSNSFTISWVSDYAVKVYFKQIGDSGFTLLNTVQQPADSYTIPYVPPGDCSIQKFEVKLVSVCPEGDSKPTVIVYSPQAHLKPYVAEQANYLCNIPNPTIDNLIAIGQNLKWYTAETGGAEMPATSSIPLNTYLVYFVSQTIDGCESERSKAVVYIQNIPTPNGPSVQQFNCSTPKIADLEVSGSNILWWTQPTGGLSPNIDYILQNNTTYYAESRSIDGLCVSSERFPVLVMITADTNSTYVLPFTETFEAGLCNLGYTSSTGYNASGAAADNNLRVATFGTNGRVFTKGIQLSAGIPIEISFKVRNYSNPGNEPLTIKIGTDMIFGNQDFLGTIIPSGNATYNNIVYNFIPTVTGTYYISFDFSSSAYFRGVYIDDLSVKSSTISIVGQNIGIPWATDIDLSTVDGINYLKSQVIIPSGQLKFRLSHAWAINWGASAASGTFPSGIGVQDGPNITAVAGTYDVSINKLTGAYNFAIPLDIKGNPASVISVYPNPANGLVNIEVKNEIIESVAIYDMLGRLIKAEIVGNDRAKIDIDTLPAAVYLLIVKTAAGGKTIKIIKN